MTRGEYTSAATDKTNREDYARAWTPVTERGKPSTIEFVPYSDGSGGVLRWNDERGIGRGVLAFTNGKISELAVQKQWRRKGIATALYAEAARRGAVESKNTITPAAMAVRHKQAVRNALSEGKPVPAEVLADYPDLAAQAPAASSAPRETGAADFIDDIPINVAVAAFANTSHTPEKRGQSRREEYAATLKSAREELDRAAVTPEQKAIADAEFARYRDGMKSRTLAYLNALSRTASSMITGPANFPVERNRKANSAADKRGEELRDFDKRARAAMLRAVNAAATPEMRASEEADRVEAFTKRFIERARAIEDGTNKGSSIALFKQNLVGKLERAAKNGETQAVARALQMLREEGVRRGKPLFVNRASIWKLADVATEAVQAEASAPTGEQEHAAYTDGTRVVRNYGDDRLRIFFPGKPSDAQRTTLKSRGFKWSPANSAWQRQNTQAAVFAADDILLGFGKQKTERGESPAPKTATQSTSRERAAEAESIAPSGELDSTGSPSSIADTINNIREGKRRYELGYDSLGRGLSAGELDAVQRSLVSGMESLRAKRAEWESRSTPVPAKAEVGSVTTQEDEYGKFKRYGDATDPTGNWKRFKDLPDDAPMAMYHATSRNAAMAILRDGYSAKQSGYTDTPPGYVYMGGWQPGAGGLGTYLGQQGKGDPVLVVFRVRKGDVEPDAGTDWKTYLKGREIKADIKRMHEGVDLKNPPAWLVYSQINQVRAKAENVEAIGYVEPSTGTFVPKTPPAPDAKTPRTKLVAMAREKGVPAETLKKSKDEIVEEIKKQESPPAIPKRVQEYADKFGVSVRVEKHGIYGNEWDYVVEPAKKDWFPSVSARRVGVDVDPIGTIQGVAEAMGYGRANGPNRFEMTDAGKRRLMESTNEPAAEAVEPAPADVAQGSEPAATEDRYGVRDAARSFVDEAAAKLASIKDEIAEALKMPGADWEQSNAKDDALRKLREQERSWATKVQSRKTLITNHEALADALSTKDATIPVQAAAIVNAWRSMPTNVQDIQWIPPAAAAARIEEAHRTLLERVSVDAMPDTTLYVWRDEYDTGIEAATKADRIKAAKDLAAKMVKEDKAARAELQRIAERGVMITDAGKVVARPEAKPIVTRQPSVGPIFKTNADKIKAITVAAAKETSRYAINGVLVANKGKRLVTTDGRRMWIHDRQQGFGVADGLMAHDGKGGLKAYPADKDGDTPTFPPYEDVIPKAKPEDNLGDHDPVKLANMLRRAALMTSEESRGVLVTSNDDGEFGFVAFAPEVGEAQIGPSGTVALFAINPEFMAEALEWHARNGAETVKIENAAPNKPIVITGYGKFGVTEKTTSVTMPVAYAADTSLKSRADLAQEAAERGAINKLDAIADRAKERLEKRAKKQGGSKTLNAGLNPEQLGTALRDTVDLSIVGAARGLAAGVRAGRALTKVVDAAIAEMGRTVTPKVRAIIQKNVRKILAESGGDPVKFEQVVKEMYEAPVTKREIKAAKDTAKAQGVAKAERTAAGRIIAATRQGYQRGRRDERRNAIANMQGVVNDIKRERGRLRSLAQFEKRAGEVAVKMTADDARRAQMIRDGIRKQVVQYARTLPKEVRGKLVGRIATADTPTKMIQTVRELQRELMRHDGREAWGWIKKNARSSAVDKLKGVTNDLRKSVADLYAKAASAKRRIDAAETLKDSSIALAELQNLQAEIGLHITTARAAFKAIKGQRQQSAFQIATNAAQIIEARFAKRSGDGVSQIRDPKRWWVRKHLDSYNDLRNMLATLEGDNGPLFSAIWEALEEGSAEYSTLRRDKRAAMEQAYVRSGFKDMADAIDSLSAFAGRGVEKNYTVTVGGESKTLSLGEISSLIAHNSDPETAALIASEHGMRFKSTEGTGSDGVIPTPNEIKDMAAAIEKDYKLAQLIDDLKAINEKDADRTLREVGELTGVQPKKVEKRWTRSRDMEMVPGMEDKPITTADPSMVNVIRSFAENMGIYEHRTQTTGIPILLKDVHSVMEEEIHKQAATLALARRVRDAMLVLTQDQLGKAIINAKGVEFYRSLKRQVMAAGRTEVVYATQAEKAVGFLKGSAAVKYLAANPSTYIGNLLGTLRVLPDVDARYYAAGIAAMWSMSRAELEAKSGYLWDRWEQQGMGRFGPSHEATMDARLTQAHTGFRSFLREIGRQVRNSMKNAGRLDLGAGLTNLRLGSAAFMQGLNWVESRIAAFTWGAMDAKIRSEQPNLSDKARQKIVEKFVRREMRETQNGGDPVDAATIATQNRSSAASMVMFLLSDVMKVRNRVKRAFRQSKTYGSKVLAAEAVGALAKAYAVKYLWDSIAFGIAGALGDDDDKERITERMKEWTSPIERAAQELFQIVAPIGGPDLASLIDALRGRYSDRARGGPVAMLAPLNDARAAGWDAFSVIAKSIENDDMNAEKIGLALAKFFDETASAFGLNPLSPWTRRVLREIVQTRKSEWW